MPCLLTCLDACASINHVAASTTQQLGMQEKERDPDRELKLPPEKVLVASPMPPTPHGAQMGQWAPKGAQMGPRRYLEVSSIALGFISTNFQPDYLIPRPFQIKSFKYE